MQLSTKKTLRATIQVTDAGDGEIGESLVFEQLTFVLRMLTMLKLNLRLQRTLVKLWRKLNESTNLLQEKSKSLRLVNKEPRLWVRERWLAYLRKVKKQLGKEEKHNATRNSDKPSN